jgi:alcohol dehydrogenase class IV
MPPLDLNALLARVHVEARTATVKSAAKAKAAQRTAADQAAHEYAQALEKRASLNRGLSSNEIDGMRFRWLADHAVHWERLAGLGLDELRREVDLAIKKEAIRRLSELRRERLKEVIA